MDLGFDLDSVTSGKCLPLSGQISSSVQWGRETVFRVPKLMAYGLPLVHSWFCLSTIVFFEKNLNNQHLKTRRTQEKYGFMASLENLLEKCGLAFPPDNSQLELSLADPGHYTLHHFLLPTCGSSHGGGTLEFVTP